MPNHPWFIGVQFIEPKSKPFVTALCVLYPGRGAEQVGMMTPLIDAPRCAFLCAGMAASAGFAQSPPPSLDHNRPRRSWRHSLPAQEISSFCRSACRRSSRRHCARPAMTSSRLAQAVRATHAAGVRRRRQAAFGRRLDRSTERVAVRNRDDAYHRGGGQDVPGRSVGRRRGIPSPR